MRFYVAGGCCEYGCNCFLLEGKEYSVLVDCGAGTGGEERPPLLTEEQVSRVRYLFLTHSHRDHGGSLDWLWDQGFQGKIYLTAETEEQLGWQRASIHVLEINEPSNNQVVVDELLTATYGRSGHCLRSVWYLLEFEDKRIFFSGDYCEHSPVYQWDPASGTRCDLAVVDCAYGDEKEDGEGMRRKIQRRLEQAVWKENSLLLPAPAVGRGVDLLLLGMGCKKEVPVFADKKVIDQVKKLYQKRKWRRCGDRLLEQALECKDLDCWNGETGILILSDPQLAAKESRKLAEQVWERQGNIVFTGHVYEGTYGAQMRSTGKAEFLRYPVHMNWEEAQKFCKRNDFHKIVLNHCASRIAGAEGTICMKRGDGIEI